MDSQHCIICGSEARTRNERDGRDGFVTKCPICGKYGISRTLYSTFRRDYSEKAYCISAWLATRTRTIIKEGTASIFSGVKDDNNVTLHTDNIKEIIQNAPHLTAREKLNKYLEVLGDVCKHDLSWWWDVCVSYDYPLVYCTRHDELSCILNIAIEEGWTEKCNPNSHMQRPTLKGWERIEDLNRIRSDSDIAFVAMWFDKSLDEIYEKGIKPALEAMRFKPIRIDRTNVEGKIDDAIVANIRRSSLVIGDFTSSSEAPGGRGGVYYEVGFAEGLGKKVVRTCKKDQIEKVHFDTRQYNHLTWETPEELRKMLINHIGAIIPSRAQYLPAE